MNYKYEIDRLALGKSRIIQKASLHSVILGHLRKSPQLKAFCEELDSKYSENVDLRRLSFSIKYNEDMNQYSWERDSKLHGATRQYNYSDCEYDFPEDKIFKSKHLTRRKTPLGNSELFYEE